MLEKDKRVRIIAGHYGSGKTEFAVNSAVALSKNAPRVVLADPVSYTHLDVYKRQTSDRGLNHAGW